MRRIERQTAVVRSARVMQLEGLFDLPPTERSGLAWEVSLPLEERAWNVGLIVGPSGCGKSTIARELFGDALVAGYNWPAEHSIVDAFPASLGIKDVAGLLSSVGFSSPPSWLRPFACLSNGEQFRVTLARALAEQPELAVIDEFTSVVDRTVAQIGSAAVAKAVRRRGQRLISVACHYDIIDWLQPDWTYEPASNEFRWRCLQPRPDIQLEIVRVHRKTWQLFSPHHYLSGSLAPMAQCYVALIDGRPAAFTATMSFPHPRRPAWREHRTVCLPDYQGVGIGNALSEFVASLYRATAKPYFSTTSNPAMIHHRARSPVWKMLRKPSMIRTRTHSRSIGSAKTRMKCSFGRITAGFEYVGPVRREDAERFGIMPS
ncbi:MAG TPA: ABC transporter ATP-binding protein [Planctomycetaceae bacterium]|nr:ABC transporter ATP-binding protein [Planctomycetaceae bacterium]